MQESYMELQEIDYMELSRSIKIGYMSEDIAELEQLAKTVLEAWLYRPKLSQK